jgi:AraC-like DNA-binding protein
VTTAHPPARHLLRAKDLIDARYREPLDVAALACAAHLSRAHFSREFRRAFGETPHQYLLTRRMERAAALLRSTDRSIADICLTVGLQSLGSFTTSFRRTYGLTPTEYRAAYPPAATHARVPTCVMLAWARPPSLKVAVSSFREDTAERPCRTTYEQLKKLGVEFSQEPTEQPYGIDAGFRDPSGNQIRMAQLK